MEKNRAVLTERVISIVIPCYNEEKNIVNTIEGLVKIESETGERFEIIPVNDGSN